MRRARRHRRRPMHDQSAAWYQLPQLQVPSPRSLSAANTTPKTSHLLAFDEMCDDFLGQHNLIDPGLLITDGIPATEEGGMVTGGVWGGRGGRGMVVTVEAQVLTVSLHGETPPT